MKLGQMLMQITNAKGTTRQEALKAEFLKTIEGHPEEKILKEACYVAGLGRDFIDFGRSIFPPKSLQNEGFVLRNAGCGFIYSWKEQ